MIPKIDKSYQNDEYSRFSKGDQDSGIPDSGKKPGTTSGNEDYGATERDPLDGHNRADERKPHI